MINATINLPTLRCHEQFDSGGPSEPYLWTAFFWADVTTVGTSVKVRVNVPRFGNSLRGFFPDGVRNGQDIAIPAEIGRQTIKLDDGGNGIVMLGALVVLLEEDSTPDDAIKHGHDVFRQAVGNELNKFVTKNGARRPTPDEVKAIASAIESATKDAIESQLSFLEKLFLNQDDFLGNTFTLLIGSEVTNPNGNGLTFPLVEKDEFQIGGPGGVRKVGHQKYEIVGANLKVEPFVPDPCAAQVLAFNQAKVGVDELQKALRTLQEQFRNAPASQKPIILEDIREIRTVDLPAAMQAVLRAQEQLTACRNSH
jgi:hypothetical protein